MISRIRCDRDRREANLVGPFREGFREFG